MKNIIVGNWKCNPNTKKEAAKIMQAVARKSRLYKNSEIVICPPSVFLPLYKKSLVKFGIQNFYYKDGAYTGEISIGMAKDQGCKYALIGHSERRRSFGETDSEINLKVKAALSAKISPILCIGETIEEKAKNKTLEVVKREILQGLSGIKDFNQIIIAYEPVWAIGAAQACSSEMAKEICVYIRQVIENVYGPGSGNKISVLYGGAVTPENAAPFLKAAGMNGLLIGRASLDPQQFLSIIKNCEN